MVKSIFKNIGCEQLVKAEMSSDGSGDDFSYLTDTALNSIELHIIIVRKLLLFEFFSSLQVRDRSNRSEMRGRKKKMEIN